MHSHTRTHHPLFGTSWSTANLAITGLLTLLFLILLLLLLNMTAQPAQAQPPPPSCFTSGIIHNFTPEESGGRFSSPSGLTLDERGNLYGTTAWGGDNGFGLAYQLWQSTRGWLFTPLYSFGWYTDGGLPSGLIVGPDGALYGTALGGGTCDSGDCGLIYRLAPPPSVCPAASCSWKQTVIYRFTGDPDGLEPSGNLVADRAGNLFGTTYYGGANGQGAVFELTPSNGGWTERIIYSFSGVGDGSQPNSLLVGHDGNLYGTTQYGGDLNCQFHYNGQSCGVVFQLARSGDAWTGRTLHTFENSQSDGAGPQNLVQDGAGNLYGISTWVAPGQLTAGVQFMLSQSNGNWTFTELLLRDYTSTGHDTVFTGLTTDLGGNTSIAGSDTYPNGDSFCNQYGFWCDWYVLGQHGFGLDQVFNGYDLVTDPRGQHLYGVTSDCGSYSQGTIWGG